MDGGSRRVRAALWLAGLDRGPGNSSGGGGERAAHWDSRRLGAGTTRAPNAIKLCEMHQRAREGGQSAEELGCVD